MLKRTKRRKLRYDYSHSRNYRSGIEPERKDRKPAVEKIIPYAKSQIQIIYGQDNPFKSRFHQGKEKEGIIFANEINLWAFLELRCKTR